MIGDQEIDLDALAKKLAQTTPVKAEDIDIDALARHLIESTDPGFKEYAVGLPKAVAKGAMDATGAGLVGLGKIGEMVSGDAVGQGLVSAGESVQRAAPQPDPRIEGDLITRTASGIGSSVPIIGGTLATGGLGGGPLAMAATAGGTSMLMEGGGGYQEAKARGADESTARTAMLLTMPLGALDALGPETGQAFRLAKVIRPARAAIERAGLTGLVDSVLSVPGRIAERSALGGMALSSGVELAQETIQGKGEVIAQQLAGTIKSDEEAKSLWDVAQSDGFPAALGSAFTEAVTQWITGGHARSHAPKTGASADQGGAALGGEADLKGQSTEAPAPTADDRAARVIDLPEDDVRAAVDKLVRDPTVQPKGENAASLPLPTIFEPAKHIADEAGAVGLRVVEVSAPGYENWEGYYDPSTGIAVVNADLPDDMKRRQVVRHEMVHFLEQNHPEVYAEWNAAVKAVAPELQAGIARTRTKTEAALGNKIAPDAATGEANAEIRQNSPTLEDIATLHPEIAAKIAAHSPGLLRRLADALIDFAHALGLSKSRSVSALTRDLHKIIVEHGTATEKALGPKRGMALFAKLAELQKAIRLEVPVAQPTSRTSVELRPRLDLPVVEADAGFPRPLTRVRVKGKPKADFVPGADDPVVRTPDRPVPPPAPREPTEDERLQALREGVRRAGLERLAALEERAGQLPQGKRRTAVEREAGALRAALEETRRQDALDATKAVGDVVLLPSGERGTVVSVKGELIKVRVDAQREDLPEDVTLGLPAQKVRTVTAGVAELVSRKGAIAPGPEAPSARQQKAAAKDEPVPKKLPIGTAIGTSKGTDRSTDEKSANPVNSKPRESHREKGAPSKSAGLPFETAKGGHAEGEKITAKLPVVYADERLKDADTRAALVSMARWEAGWEQEGGKLIFTEDASGKREVSGRTKWIAKADWWASRPEDARLNERETREAVRKANAGEKLTAEESRLIQHMLDASETRSEVVGEGSFTGFLMSGLSDEEMDRREREAIQNESEVEDVQPSSDLPFARPQTETPEFKAWFGDSKVVDENGKPLVVYHGTPNAGLSVFDSGRIGANGRSEGAGFYFTTDKSIADGYGQRGETLAVFLSINKPLAYDAKPFSEVQIRKLLAEVSKAETKDTGTVWRDGFLSNFTNTYDRSFDSSVREAAKLFVGEESALNQVSGIVGSGVDADTVNIGLTNALGYDGFFSKGFSGEGQRGGDIWVAMRPTQIKSATGNRGTFNANDPDIRHARPTPPVTGSVLANITRRWGADNAERQTARISTDENVRGFQAGVRNAVLDRPLMKQQSRAAWRKQAETELRTRPKELREDLIAKWRSNQILEPWEQIAWALMTEKAAKRMFRTMSVEDTKEAIKLETMIEMYRTSQARGMAAYVDATKQWSSGAEAFTAVVAKARTKTREKIEALRKLMLEPAPDEIQFAREKELEALLEEEVAVTQKVIAELRKAGLDPDLVTIDYFRDPYIFARAARIAATTKSTKRDVYLEWRVAAMLSFPPTQMANIAGNTAHIGYRGVLGRIATATANLAARDPNAASFGELPHYIGAMLSALPEAGRNWLMAMQTELPAMDVKLANQGVDIPFLSTQVDALEAGKQAIPGWIGRIMRFPSTTTLLAFDEFFKTLAYHSEAVSQAYRIAKAEGYDGAALRGRIDELIADTTSPLHVKAWQESRVLLFQDTENSPTLRAIMALRRGADDAAKVPLGSILFPFVRTPYRIFTRGMAIPFSPVVAVHHALTGKWKNEPGLREQDIGASILGLAVVLGIASMIGDDDDPWITGSTSMNRGQRELDQRSFPPMSFRVGDSWYSYARIEPFATAFATIIDSVRDWSHHPQESTPERIMSTTGALVQSVTQQAGDKTFLRTFGEIVKLQQEAQQGNLGGAVTDFGIDTMFTPMIPNAIRGTLRASDEYMRANPSRSLDDEGVAERALKAAPYKALPIGSLAPPIKYDLWGRPVERPGFAFVERVLSPMMRQGEVDHVLAADLAIRRWNTLVESGQRPDGKKYLPLAPSYTSRGHKWNDEEYATLCRESGKLAAQRIRDGYVLDYENPSQEDIDAIRDALHDAQTEVRERLHYERSRR